MTIYDIFPIYELKYKLDKKVWFARPDPQRDPKLGFSLRAPFCPSEGNPKNPSPSPTTETAYNGGAMGGGRGGHKRGRTQRRDFRQGRDNVWKKPRDSNPKWEPFATQNSAFDEYYKVSTSDKDVQELVVCWSDGGENFELMQQEQGIVLEEEWDEFIRVLRKPLPAAFRINSRSVKLNFFFPKMVTF